MSVVVGSGNEPLAHQLGCPHYVGRVYRLVGDREDNVFHFVFAGGMDNVLNAENISLHCLKRGMLTQDHVLEGRRVEHHIDVFHFPAKHVPVANITKEKSGVIVSLVPLFEEKYPALIIIDPDQCLYPIIFQ